MGKGDEQDPDDPVLDPREPAPVEGDIGIPGAVAVAGGIAGFVLGAALGPVLGTAFHPLCVIAGAIGGWFGGARLQAMRYVPAVEPAPAQAEEEEEGEEEEAEAPAAASAAAAPDAPPESAPAAAAPPPSTSNDPLGAPTPTATGGEPSDLDHSLGSSQGHERPPG